MVGSLLYLSRATRWDISYAVLHLTRATSKSSTAHLKKAKRVLRDLKEHQELDIVYRSGYFKLWAFADTSFANDPDKRRSTSGYIFLFAGAPISCVSSLQSLTALSTIESELVAITPCMKEACHIQDLLRELKFNVRENQHRKRLDWGNFRRFHKWILSKDQAPTTTQVVLQGSHRAWTDQRQFPSFPQMDTQQGPSTSNYASGSARISSSVDESAFILSLIHI